MKHDFETDPDSGQARRFREWLEVETTAALRRDFGNLDAVRSSVFLFVNRAFEARMPESEIAEIFARSVVNAGYPERDEEPMFGLLEGFAEVARQVHGGP